MFTLINFEAKLSLFPAIFVIGFLCGHVCFNACVIHHPLLQVRSKPFSFRKNVFLISQLGL